MIPPVDLLPNNSVVCLMSPTASGKTDLACRLYETGRFQLISVDSALIYRDMNIGTAKPTASELLIYPHALVDIVEPTETYNVASFVCEVQELIKRSHKANKIPLLVGGTMMYYMALFEGISAVPQTDEQIRKEVARWHKDVGNEGIYEYLLKNDPVICQKLKVFDTQRLIRAVEVHRQTNRPMSDWQSTPKTALSDNSEQVWHGICVMPDRVWLHDRIEQRLAMMWQVGFVDEVIYLITHYPVTPDMPSMRCVGYRQVLDYLIATGHDCLKNAHFEVVDSAEQADITIKTCQEMKNKALYATRQLAKRQYTWLRRLSVMTAKANATPKNNIKMATFDSIRQVQQSLL